MKFSKRVKLIVIGALFATMFVAGSAWAVQTADQVEDIIEAYGFSDDDVTTSESTITVNGTLSKEMAPLALGDLTGLTIDWKANLTVTGAVIGHDANVVTFQNGTFNMTAGKIELQALAAGGASPTLMAIEDTGNGIITISGATVTGIQTGHIGVVGENTKITVSSGGTVNFPNSVLHGAAVKASELTVNDGTINGPAISSKYIVDTGTWTVDASMLDMANGTTFTINNGGTLILTGAGPLNNYGTVTNKGALTNNSTINNYSSNTIDNQGTLTNNGAMNNTATGKIKNTGTIDNAAAGAIVNRGIFDNTGGNVNNQGTFESTQTAAEMGGNFDGRSIEPINSNGGSGSGGGGGGGCNAGFGVFALAAVALLLMRKN